MHELHHLSEMVDVIQMLNWVNWFNWTKSITQLDTINCTDCTIKLNCLHSSNSQRSRHKQTAQIAKPILIGPSGSHGQSSLNSYMIPTDKRAQLIPCLDMFSASQTIKTSRSYKVTKSFYNQSNKDTIFAL